MRIWITGFVVLAGLVAAQPFVTTRTAAQETDTAPKPRTLVTFSAMGDIPYDPYEDEILKKQVAELPEEAEFVIHVGDIKRGQSVPCEEPVYAKVAGMLAASTKPVLIIPGDNEWNDCLDPELGWKNWTKHFMRFDERWPQRLRVFRQLEREENFAFVRNGVLFIGINIVGGRVHDAEEWQRRLTEDLIWVRRNLERFGNEVSSVVVFGHATPTAKHEAFFTGFVEEAQKFGQPVLYLHGDGHRWKHDRPFAAKNILRVEVDQGAIAAPVTVTVTDDPQNPFNFDRRLHLAPQQPENQSSPTPAAK